MAGIHQGGLGALTAGLVPQPHNYTICQQCNGGANGAAGAVAGRAQEGPACASTWHDNTAARKQIPPVIGQMPRFVNQKAQHDAAA